MQSVGIIGNGFVGGSIAKAFAEDYIIKVYDINKDRSLNSFEETVKCDFVFVCLPTPMVDAEGGKPNLSIVHDFFDDVNSLGIFDRNHTKPDDSIFIIKSTVPVGTTHFLCEKFETTRILHSPEFLRAKTASIDFLTATRHIVGHHDKLPENYLGPAPEFFGNRCAELFEKRFPGTRVIQMTSNESEFVKYSCNCFLATKVMFFNEIKLLADKMNMDWEVALKGIMSDGRIGHSHYQVPGFDGDMGFGGGCFPKDINAFINTMEESEIDPIVLKAVWEQNKNVRKNWDWSTMESAVKKETV